MTTTAIRPTATRTATRDAALDAAVDRATETLELADFVAATQMCDAGSEAIHAAALEITRGTRTQREAAVALFYWVRDEVEYTMGDWNWRASETLRLRKGTCSNKANLMVAMARALGIPAGFHIQYVTTDSYFRGAFIPLIQRSVRDRAIHVYVTLWLDGRWVKCDPTDDKALCDSIDQVVPHATTLDFDGEHDAMLPFREGSVLSDRGPFSDIDADLTREARISAAHKALFGRFVAFMRDSGGRYDKETAAVTAQIEADFLEFFADVEPSAYAELMGLGQAA